MMQFESNAIIPHDPILEYNDGIKVDPQGQSSFLYVTAVNKTSSAASYLYLYGPKASIKDLVYMKKSCLFFLSGLSLDPRGLHLIMDLASIVNNGRSTVYIHIDIR